MTFLNKIKFWTRSYIRHLNILGGFWKVNKYLFEKHIARKKQLQIPISNKTHRVNLRNHTSDIEIFAQIFINEEYKLGIQNMPPPDVIIDCGANIGLATIYFKHWFPEATIYAFEPAYSNYIQLQKNIAHYNNIKIYNKAIWNETKRLQINLQAPYDSISVTQNYNDKNNMVDAISLDDFLMKNAIDKIDLLKIDIEGAEFPLFSKNLDWIDKTNKIIVEIHEKLNPGSTKYINNLLAPKFTISYTGEYVIYSRKLDHLCLQ